MLRIRNLEKSYASHDVLRGVDLDISPGEIVALLGPNGAGKTTLASIVAGLRRPDSGSIRVGDIDVVRNAGRARTLLGLAPQHLGIYPTLTARQNLLLFGRIAGVSGRGLRDRIDEVSTGLALSDLLDRKAGILSGGQQRRLHTAMAMLHRPRLLLLDEPTVGADVESRRQILAFVRDLAARGTAVCYATHYLPEVDDLDATVAVLNGGRIVYRGSVSSLARAHGTSGVRLAFRGDPPDLAGFETDGSHAFRTVDQPGVEIARTLADGTAWVSRLESVEIIRPSLETAYLALTVPTTTETEEQTHVA